MTPRALSLLPQGIAECASSVLTTRVADSLALPRRPGKVLNFNKIVPMQWITVPDVELGPIRVSQLPMLVSDLNYNVDARGVDAVIGLDLLRKTSFAIDHINKEVQFGELDPMPYKVPMNSAGVALTVELQLGGVTLFK